MKKNVTKPPDEHEGAIANTAKVARELAYNIIDLNYENKPGPDLIIQNPKNGRVAWIEVETRFQKQKQTASKYQRRYSEIIEKGEDVILLITGVSRDEITGWTSDNEPVLPGEEYGKTIFTCTSYYDLNELRAVLLRCLGDD